MKVLGQGIAWSHPVFSSIVGNLPSIHGGCRDLDASSKVEVLVAQMVGEGLNPILGETSAVGNDLVVDRQGSGDSGMVGDHEEVKEVGALALHEASVEAGPWGRVDHVAILSEEPMGDSLVHQAIQHPRLVPLLVLVDGAHDKVHFLFSDLGLHGGAADAVPVEVDLIREVALVFLLVGLEGQLHLPGNDLSALFRDDIFLNILFVAVVFAVDVEDVLVVALLDDG
mmetsp:Transcript_29509/g.28666  ORF Transcript_29509/g.28666 Transcript_29509/m.28666 type:complete len:226 (-) Transcript_29509:1693-2370(-)